MKYLFINTVCGTGSTGRICAELAETLDKQGNEVKIAYGRGEVSEKCKRFAVPIGSKACVYAHALRARVFDSSGYGSKTATERFIKWVKEYDPEIIHLHNVHGYYLNIEVLFDYLKICGKKIIWTLHDCWAFTGHAAYCDSVNCEKWETGCGHCPKLDEYPASLIDRSKRNWLKKEEIFTGVYGLTLVCPSYWLESLVKRSFLKEYPARVIHNGIDLNTFFPDPNNFREKNNLNGKIVVLGVSNVWEKRKGLEDFIKLAGILPDKYRIVVVGVTDKQKENFPRNMIGISRTKDVNELREIYSDSDVFINLTRDENYPTTNLEAQACNTPCITYRTGGSVESVPEENVINKGDLNALADRIREITMSKNNEGHIKQFDMSKENASMEYMKLYMK